MKYFAVHLKAKRLEKGWDQEQLAHMSGLSVRTIQRIEADHSCSLESIKSLSAVLELKHFSELLPAIQENEVRPGNWYYFLATVHELVVHNLVNAIMLSGAIVGLLTVGITLLSIDRLDENLSFEARVVETIELNKKLKDFQIYPSDNRTLNWHQNKSKQEIEEQVRIEMLDEQRALNKEEWIDIKERMIAIFKFSFILTTIFSFINLFSRREFDHFIIRPLLEKISDFIASKRLNF